MCVKTREEAEVEMCLGSLFGNHHHPHLTWFLTYHLAFLPLCESLAVKETSSTLPCFTFFSVGSSIHSNFSYKVGLKRALDSVSRRGDCSKRRDVRSRANLFEQPG